ncbi:hypothetical protein AL475_07050 [Vibrio fluvialis]|nr:hypothetical protein AL475_07050 [Vibrio fluvialis]TOY91145.1 hypothetical protein DJ016_21675 [Vibrio fluvialis]TRN08558.1 hypothetical protein DM587_21540 [Vibrio fluvialis]
MKKVFDTTVYIAKMAASSTVTQSLKQEESSLTI